MTRPRISFEFFPPRSIDAAFRLSETVRMLAPLQPHFVSVTYGAGGTTRQLTHEAVAAIQGNYGLNVAAHLTCVEATRAETLAIAEQYAAVGVREIVALRGDAPKGAAHFTPHPEGFRDTVELVAALAATGQFKLHVGAYPERHPDAADDQADVRWLKRKLDAGASSAITQFFFQAETFLRFRDACAAAGIVAPIIPGIMPVDKWANARRFAARCGASVPAALDAGFEAAIAAGRHDEFAIDSCTALCQRLLAEGVADLHFYTLNRPYLTREVCLRLGIEAAADPA